MATNISRVRAYAHAGSRGGSVAGSVGILARLPEGHHHAEVVQADPAILVPVRGFEDDLRVILGDVAVPEVLEKKT